jgi:hypothetical protein
MKRTRQVLVMTLMATALCADRVSTAAPEVRAQLEPAADPIARLATRLSVAFRRVVPAVRLHQHRHEAFAAPAVVTLVAVKATTVHATRGSPFQFRLPPPSV